MYNANENNNNKIYWLVCILGNSVYDRVPTDKVVQHTLKVDGIVPIPSWSWEKEWARERERENEREREETFRLLSIGELSIFHVRVNKIFARKMYEKTFLLPKLLHNYYASLKNILM